MGSSCLIRVGKRWYYQRRVNSRLRGILHKDSLRFSLHTEDADVALFIGRKINAVIDEATAVSRFFPDEAPTLIGRLRAYLPEARQQQGQSGKNDVLLFSQGFELYTAERMRVNPWEAKTLKEIQQVGRVFQRICGDLPISEIDRGTILRVQETLLRLPPGFEKSPNYRDKSITELTGAEHDKHLSVARINKMLVFLKAFFQWAIGHGHVKELDLNGLRLKGPRIRASEERMAYSETELVAILEKTSTLRNTSHAERYWVPLIAIHSGMRLGEICQLHLTDLREVDGVWVFDINDGPGHRIKNHTSRRMLPIHTRVLNTGLLAYAQSLHASGQQRLFPALYNHSLDGWSHGFGKWFQEFNRREISVEPRKTFHSIRHSVATILKNKMVQAHLISELLGHSPGEGMTLGRYAKAATITTLQKIVELIAVTRV
ncbi:MAG: site-specific integrase [Candidatus Riflebacteria bacterium]|nr:site-specific integrase [Candidatus Riflebacteria bacterium]